MVAWLLWIGAAGVLGVAEMLSMGLFLAPFALGAALAGLLAAIGAGFSVSLAAFAVAALLLLFALRPLVLARWRAPLRIRTGTAALVGSLQAMEQLTITTLRNVIGGISLEATLTSRDHINGQLRVVLDDATGKWGIRVNRVELKSIDPPNTIQEAMAKQMRAERDRRAAILNAEGIKQSQILTAEGEQQSAVLRAEGARQAAILRAEGEAKAIETVFSAIHEGRPDPQLLCYQYLRMLPELARGEANKVFLIPSEFSQAFGGLSQALERRSESAAAAPEANGRTRSLERAEPRDVSDDGHFDQAA